jgi:hypothetical protein
LVKKKISKHQKMGNNLIMKIIRENKYSKEEMIKILKEKYDMDKNLNLDKKKAKKLVTGIVHKLK